MEYLGNIFASKYMSTTLGTNVLGRRLLSRLTLSRSSTLSFKRTNSVAQTLIHFTSFITVEADSALEHNQNRQQLCSLASRKSRYGAYWFRATPARPRISARLMLRGPPHATMRRSLRIACPGIQGATNCLSHVLPAVAPHMYSKQPHGLNVGHHVGSAAPRTNDQVLCRRCICYQLPILRMTKSSLAMWHSIRGSNNGLLVHGYFLHPANS